MARINVLGFDIANLIAAGEVVDRPYSVVKELIENSIDAGATEIEVHIEQGGKQLIRVIDNGHGIERDDLQSAFLPHATSKIAKAEDLDNIMTLGFRGEAIASISAVSKMTITSKTATGKCYSLTSDGGQLGQIVEASGQNGTDVCVEMLFFNTPVRLGFLKSDKAEESEITTFISRFILCKPNISFTYYVNGKKVLQSFGGGDEEALVSVYGAAVLADCYLINAVKHGVRIRGYIGGRNFYKANKSYQNVFLNGRYVLNATIASSISNAYSSYLMKRQYPFYALHIDVPTEIVDVNVHPNKADVRFADNQIIYGCIYSVISAVLDGHTKALEYIVKAPKSVEIQPIIEEKEEPKKEEVKNLGFGVATLSYEEAQKEIAKSAPTFKAQNTGDLALPFVLPEGPPEEIKRYPKGVIPKSQTSPPIPKAKTWAELEELKKRQREEAIRLNEEHRSSPPLTFKDLISSEEMGKKLMALSSSLAEDRKKSEQVDVFAENKRFLEAEEKRLKQESMTLSEWKYAGKLFNTYLLYERGDDVYIIDQHAAHERIIFNELKERMERRDAAKQPMLVPFLFPVNYFEANFLRERMQDICDIGFTIEEPEENLFKVTELPLDLHRIDLINFFNTILADINNYRKIKLVDIMRDKLALTACKAAIKGGMDITRPEIDALFKMMDGDMTLKCPHGRPVVVKKSKKEFEKMFKRIV